MISTFVQALLLYYVYVKTSYMIDPRAKDVCKLYSILMPRF
jgi:hypothetical protein